jgi:hypothetical protein
MPTRSAPTAHPLAAAAHPPLTCPPPPPRARRTSAAYPHTAVGSEGPRPLRGPRPPSSAHLLSRRLPAHRSGVRGASTAGSWRTLATTACPPRHLSDLGHRRRTSLEPLHWSPPSRLTRAGRCTGAVAPKPAVPCWSHWAGATAAPPPDAKVQLNHLGPCVHRGNDRVPILQLSCNYHMQLNTLVRTIF